MKPINPGSYKKTDLKESSSRFFYYGEHQAPFALPVKILLKRKHRTVMTVLRPSNTQLCLKEKTENILESIKRVSAC